MPRTPTKPATLLRLNHLELDRQNPRLPIPPRAGQNLIRQLLIDNEEVISLANDVIAGGGLLRTDNIVVMRDGAGHIVLEGNRRVAACQIINDPSLLPVADRGRLRTASITPELRRSTSTLMAVVVDSRDEALSMIVKRHTSQGTRPWRPAAKARLVATLHARGMTVAGIAEKMSDTASNVRRVLFQKHLLEIAAEAPDLKDVANDQYTKANAFTRFFTLGPTRRAFPIGVNDDGSLDKGDLTDVELRQAIVEAGRVFLLKRAGGNKPLFDTRDDAVNILNHLSSQSAALRRVISSHTQPSTADGASVTVPAVVGARPLVGPNGQQPPPVSTTQPTPAIVPAMRGRPRHETFFKGMPCSIQNNILQQVAGELSRIDHERFPSAAHYLMRATLEQTLWYAIKAKSKVGALQAFVAAQNASPTVQSGTPGAASTAGGALTPPLAAHVGTQQPQRLPGLEAMIGFCIQDLTIFPLQPARTILGQIRDNKKLADLVIHGHALANPTLLESAAALVRPFLEHVYDGTYL